MRTVRTLAFGAIAALLIAACGSSDSSSSNSSPATAAPTTAAAKPTTAPTTAAGGATPSSGVTAPDKAATGEPVTIGLVNQEGGTLSLPQVRIGIEQGWDYVNQHMNGLAGHPVKLLRCDVDGSPEKSVDCANKFVEADVVAIQSGVDLGGDGMLPIIRDAGIPIFGWSPGGTQQQSALDIARFFGASPQVWSAAMLKNAANLGVKKLALFTLDLPTTRDTLDRVVKPTAEQLGIDLKPIIYDPANPDWNVLVTTAMAADPDMIGVVTAQESDCTGFIKAARSLNYDGKLFAGGCTDFIKALGEDAAGVEGFSDQWLPAIRDQTPPETQAEMDAFIEQMTSSGNEDLINSYGTYHFAVTATFARAMQSLIGTPTKESVLAALTTANNVEGFMKPTYDCTGAAWPGSTSCGTAMVFYEVQPDGTWKVASDGFVDAREFAPK